jgi:hypothetical protein
MRSKHPEIKHDFSRSTLVDVKMTTSVSQSTPAQPPHYHRHVNSRAQLCTSTEPGAIRLTPIVYAWLAARLPLAQQAARQGRVRPQVVDTLEFRLTVLRENVAHHYGEPAILSALRHVTQAAPCPFPDASPAEPPRHPIRQEPVPVALHHGYDVSDNTLARAYLRVEPTTTPLEKMTILEQIQHVITAQDNMGITLELDPGDGGEPIPLDQVDVGLALALATVFPGCEFATVDRLTDSPPDGPNCPPVAIYGQTEPTGRD